MARGKTIRWRDLVRESPLTSTQKLIAYTVASYFDGEATKAQRLSFSDIAEAASMSERTVGRTVAELEAFGFFKLQKARATRDVRGRTVRGHYPHVYDLQLPDPTWTEIPRQSMAAKLTDVATLASDVDTVSTSTWTLTATDVDTVAEQLEEPTRDKLENPTRLRSSNVPEHPVVDYDAVAGLTRFYSRMEWTDEKRAETLRDLDDPESSYHFPNVDFLAHAIALTRVWTGIGELELAERAA